MKNIGRFRIQDWLLSFDEKDIFDANKVSILMSLLWNFQFTNWWVRKISSLVDPLCLPGDFAYDRIGCHCIENWVEVWKRSKKRNFWGLIVDVVEYEGNCSIYCKSFKNRKIKTLTEIVRFNSRNLSQFLILEGRAYESPK